MSLYQNIVLSSYRLLTLLVWRGPITCFFEEAIDTVILPLTMKECASPVYILELAREQFFYLLYSLYVTKLKLLE